MTISLCLRLAVATGALTLALEAEEAKLSALAPSARVNAPAAAAKRKHDEIVINTSSFC